jgi:hypothetical protein
MTTLDPRGPDTCQWRIQGWGPPRPDTCAYNCFVTDNDQSGGYLSLDEVLGASVIHLKREIEGETEKGPCLGLAIYAYSRVQAVRYEIEIVEFTHPSQMICEKWRCEIQRLLSKL